MKMFIDTHDAANGSFPAGISKVDFASFYESYLAACREEGVISMQVNVGFGDGRAFCVSLARDAEAVRRAHERVGLSFDTITEVEVTSPAAMFAAASLA